MTGSCRLCKFWQATDHGYGNCRRFPPQMVADRQAGVVAWWPRTGGGEVCGEFKEKA